MYDIILVIISNQLQLLPLTLTRQGRSVFPSCYCQVQMEAQFPIAVCLYSAGEGLLMTAVLHAHIPTGLYWHHPKRKRKRKSHYSTMQGNLIATGQQEKY